MRRRKVEVGDFYMGTLLIWGLWVAFQITNSNSNIGASLSGSGSRSRSRSRSETQLLPIVASFFFFQIANYLLRYFVSKDPLFVNTSVSLLHSFLTSSFVVFILVNQWRVKGSLQMFEHDQLVHNTWPSAYTVLCISCGYFAYDQWDMLKYRLYSGPFPSILAHHFLLLLCFTLALFRNVTINYLILTLICELHSVFLHVRKVRRMAGIRTAESAIVKVEWVLNWATFIFSRVIPHALILIKLVKDASKFDKGIELPLAFFGMIGMNALNIGLGIDLLGAYKREISPPHNHHSD